MASSERQGQDLSTEQEVAHQSSSRHQSEEYDPTHLSVNELLYSTASFNAIVKPGTVSREATCVEPSQNEGVSLCRPII